VTDGIRRHSTATLEHLDPAVPHLSGQALDQHLEDLLSWDETVIEYMLTSKNAKKRSFLMLVLFAFMSIGSLSFCFAFLVYRVKSYPSAWLAAISLLAIVLISLTIKEEDQRNETAD